MSQSINVSLSRNSSAAYLPVFCVTVPGLTGLLGLFIITKVDYRQQIYEAKERILRKKNKEYYFYYYYNAQYIYKLVCNLYMFCYYCLHLYIFNTIVID